MFVLCNEWDLENLNRRSCAVFRDKIDSMNVEIATIRVTPMVILIFSQRRIMFHFFTGEVLFRKGYKLYLMFSYLSE